MRVPQTYYSAFDRDRGSEKQEQIIGTVDRMPIWLIRRSMPLARWIARRKKRRYVLLMEDLGHARLGDQVRGGAPADCERALIAMAAAHAALWQSPQLEGRFYLTRQDLQTRTRHSMFRDARDAFTKRFAALLPLGLDRLVEWLDVNGAEVARRLHADAPQTLIHGDFRLRDGMRYGSKYVGGPPNPHPPKFTSNPWWFGQNALPLGASGLFDSRPLRCHLPKNPVA